VNSYSKTLGLVPCSEVHHITLLRNVNPQSWRDLRSDTTGKVFATMLDEAAAPNGTSPTYMNKDYVDMHTMREVLNDVGHA